MSKVEDIKTLEDASPQSSWIFVEDCDVDTAHKKYYLNCSTEPVTELTEGGEKKDHESDSDSISVISESDDSKEENKETAENGTLVKINDMINGDTIDALYSKLYAFGCLLLAVVLPILLNYIMHNTSNNPSTYLSEYDMLADEFSNDFLENMVDDIERLSIIEDGKVISYTDLKDSNELVNVNIVTDQELEYQQSEAKIREERKPIDTDDVEINEQPPYQTELENMEHENFNNDLKHKRHISLEPKVKPHSKVEKTKDYKNKIKEKSDKHKKNRKYSSDGTDKKVAKKENSERKTHKHKHDKPAEPACGKELSKLRRKIVNQEKQIRELNRSLRDRERQIKIIQQKIFQELKELKYIYSENNRYKRNVTQSVSGEWYGSYFDHRDKARKRKHEADWFFDRAHYRQKKRVPDKNWYINWMLQREDDRKRTDWHFSF